MRSLYTASCTSFSFHELYFFLLHILNHACSVGLVFMSCIFFLLHILNHACSVEDFGVKCPLDGFMEYVISYKSPSMYDLLISMVATVEQKVKV